MKIKEVFAMNDIKKGDVIIITGDTLTDEPIKVEKIKVSDNDGTEVILNVRKNRFFNLGMYLQGKSWVKSLHVLVK